MAHTWTPLNGKKVGGRVRKKTKTHTRFSKNGDEKPEKIPVPKSVREGVIKNVAERE